MAALAVTGVQRELGLLLLLLAVLLLLWWW
jgi:hypothetical protein